MPDDLKVAPPVSGIVPISGIALQSIGTAAFNQTTATTTTAAAVSYWTESIGAHIIEYDSKTKQSFHKKWPTEDDTIFDIDYYMANLRKGLYNKGFAVRTGKLNRGPYKDYYLICIDFDTPEAFSAWCGEDYNLEILAKWTRVDWHKDPKRIHAFFISKIPLKDLARNNNNQIIEMYGKNPHLVCAYGIHRDGNPIGPYDTEEIAVIDDAKVLEIQNRIKSVIPALGNVYDYSRNDNTAAHEYIQELKNQRLSSIRGSFMMP